MARFQRNAPRAEDSGIAVPTDFSLLHGSGALQSRRIHPLETAASKIVCLVTEPIVIAEIDEIPEGESRTYPYGETVVAIFCRGGEFFAVDDICPHMGASLAGGYFDGTAVTCPWHAWRFCVANGTWLDNPKSPVRLRCHPLRVEDGKILMPPPPRNVADGE